jgi:peptidoglycan/xylan/chitin deacetylase (PgdA/CDA1 family)
VKPMTMTLVGESEGPVKPNLSLAHLAASASRGLAKHVPTKPFLMRKREPLVSFTFDDVPASAHLNGARVLDQHGIRGTFYVAPGICGTQDSHWQVITEDNVRSLHAAGHEIGCHTHSHVKVQTLSRQDLAVENSRSFEALRNICGDVALTNFAYPFGSVSFPRKHALDKTFNSCRSIYRGFNSGLIDLGMLRSHELYDRTQSAQSIDDILDRAVESGAWVIFYTHDVADTPSWIGCTPRLLEETVRAAKSRGIACVAIDEALRRIGAAR